MARNSGLSECQSLGLRGDTPTLSASDFGPSKRLAADAGRRAHDLVKRFSVGRSLPQFGHEPPERLERSFDDGPGSPSQTGTASGTSKSNVIACNRPSPPRVA